jgi:hypothetical protein
VQNASGAGSSQGGAAAGALAVGGAAAGQKPAAGVSGSSGGEPTGACFGAAIDIRTGVVSGTIKVAGEPSATDRGTLSLSRGSETFALGKTSMSSFSLRVLPGTYDVIYQSKAGGKSTVKPGVVVQLAGSTVIDVDIPASVADLAGPQGFDPSLVMALKGSLTVKGEPPPADLLGFMLTAHSPQAIRTLGNVTAGGYSGGVPPGTYDIELSNVSETPAPAWRPLIGQVLAHDVVVSTDPTLHDIDVRVAQLSGSVTILGLSPLAGNLVLSSATAGRATLIPDSAGAFSQSILPATYDVIYGAITDTTDGPRNSSALIKSGLVVSEVGPNVLDVSVPSVAISGAITVAGSAVTEPVDDGSVYLRGAGEDQITLGTALGGSYSTRVVPGTYDVYFRAADTLFSKRAPLNPNGKVKTITLAAGDAITLDIDVPAIEVSGTISIDGSLVDKEYDGGRLWLNDGQYAPIPIGWTSTGKFSARVLPGTYDVLYEGTSPSKQAPFNGNIKSKIGCLVVPQ